MDNLHPFLQIPEWEKVVENYNASPFSLNRRKSASEMWYFRLRWGNCRDAYARKIAPAVQHLSEEGLSIFLSQLGYGIEMCIWHKDGTVFVIWETQYLDAFCTDSDTYTYEGLREAVRSRWCLDLSIERIKLLMMRLGGNEDE